MGRPKKNTNTKSTSFKRKATADPKNTVTKEVEEPVVVETNEEELQQQETVQEEQSIVDEVVVSEQGEEEEVLDVLEDSVDTEAEETPIHWEGEEKPSVVKSVTEVKLEKITKEDKKPEVDESNVTVIKLEKVGSKVEEKQENVEAEVKDNENNQDSIIDEAPILEDTVKQEEAEPKKKDKKRSTWEETFHYLYY